MKKILSTLSLFTLLTSSVAFAADEPVSTTATYGAWTVRCNTITNTDADAAPKQLCEMVQSIRIRDTGQVIMEIALGRLQDSDPVSMVFKLPSAVWLREDVNISYGDKVKDTVDLTASYFRCQAQFCLADLKLDDEQQVAIIEEKSLVVGFADGTQKIINIPVSLDGYKPAFNAVFEAVEAK